MCRLALTLGRPRPIGDLFTGPHGLEVQAYAPRELQHGTVNVDGTGLAWWPGDGPPLRYATVAPPWADPNLASLGPRLHGHTVLAAVRGGTPGVGHGVDHVAPFVVGGDLAIAHNGWLGGFRDGVAATLLRRLPDDLLGGLPVVGDSRLLAAAIVGRRRRGVGLAEAVTDALREAAEVCRAAGHTATLNVAVTDGREAVATRASSGLPGNSLYVATEPPGWSGCLLAASEPLDGSTGGDGPWQRVPDGTLVHLTSEGIAHHPLALDEEPA